MKNYGIMLELFSQCCPFDSRQETNFNERPHETKSHFWLRDLFITPCTLSYLYRDSMITQSKKNDNMKLM